MTKKRAVKITPDVNEAIHGAIARAIMQGRLKAGTRLPEHRLAAIFGVSRERIRKVLHRLAAERRLELSLNRGARVPCPTIDDVKRIYEAHRVLEVGVLTQLIEIIDRGLFARLDAHLAAERAAAEQHDRAEFGQIVRRVSSSPCRRACQSGAVSLSARPAKPILRDGFGIRTSQPIDLRSRRAWRDRRGTSREKPGAGHRSFAPSFSARRAAFALRAGTGDYHRPRKCSR